MFKALTDSCLNRPRHENYRSKAPFGYPPFFKATFSQTKVRLGLAQLCYFGNSLRGYVVQYVLITLETFSN